MLKKMMKNITSYIQNGWSQNRLKISANNAMSDRNPSLISKNFDKSDSFYRSLSLIFER